MLINILVILFVYLTMWKIVPKLHYESEKHGLEVIGLQTPIHVSVFVVNYWWLCLIALVAAVGLFEWMYKSENKPSIRSFILVGLSLVSVVFALWVAFWTAVSFAMLPS